jgi:hypothetical protein
VEALRDEVRVWLGAIEGGAGRGPAPTEFPQICPMEEPEQRAKRIDD